MANLLKEFLEVKGIPGILQCDTRGLCYIRQNYKQLVGVAIGGRLYYNLTREVSNLPKKKASSERVKLDEILKSLFTVSSKVLIYMLNSLFKENYAAEATEVSFASNEFVDDAYNILRGDLFLKLSDADKSDHYHIEIQTLNDDSMVIRMLEYGISKANARHNPSSPVGIVSVAPC